MPEMAFLNCGVRIVHAAVPTVLSDLILVQGAVLGEYLRKGRNRFERRRHVDHPTGASRIHSEVIHSRRPPTHPRLNLSDGRPTLAPNDARAEIAGDCRVRPTKAESSRFLSACDLVRSVGAESA